MSTFREIYFKLKNENNHFTDEVIFSLFNDSTGLNKTDILLNFDKEVNDIDRLNDMVQRINDGEPYQYVLGYTYFLGSKFYVDNSTLIPRQETEQLVLDLLKIIKEMFGNSNAQVLDMCSGSGIIGISIDKEINANVDMVDISESANKVCRKNIELNKTNCNVYQSDLFNDLPPKKYDVIVSNPPYIKDKSTVDINTLKYEPHIALFASPQTYFYEEIFKAKSSYLNDKFLLAFEIDEDMEVSLTILIRLYFDNVSYIFKKDMYDKTRFLYIWSK